MRPSSLRFAAATTERDAALGNTTGNSGQGPPTTKPFHGQGWIRTDHFPNQKLVNRACFVSCSAWDPNGVGDRGTLVVLADDWRLRGEPAEASLVYPYLAIEERCSERRRGWCVED